MKNRKQKQFKNWIHGGLLSPADKEITMHQLHQYIEEMDTLTITIKTDSTIEFENNWYSALAKRRKRRDLNAVSAGKLRVQDDGSGRTQVLYMFAFDRTRSVFMTLGIVLALLYMLMYLFYTSDQLFYLLLQLAVFPFIYMVYYSIRLNTVRAFRRFVKSISQIPSNGR